MVGIASRYFAGRIVLVAAAAVAVGVLTGMDGTGHVVMYATIVLGAAAGAFALLFALALTVGDGDSPDRQRAHDHPAVPAYWPVIAAFGMGVLMVGLVTDSLLVIVGVAALVVSALEWTISAWAEHLSVDAAQNAAQRVRLMRPFEVSLFGVLAIAVPVLLVSRVLLATSRNTSSWIAIIAATVVLAFAFVVYAKPQLRRSILASALTLGAVGLIAAGITAAAVGEREFHPHTPSGEAGDHGDAGHGSPSSSQEH